MLLGLLQEVHDLLKLFLGLVHAGDVLEGDLSVGLDIDLRPALADGHEAAAEPLLAHHAPEQEHPQRKNQDEGHDPGEKLGQEIAVRAARDLHAVFREILGERRIDSERYEAGLTVFLRLFVVAEDPGLGHRDLGNLPVLQLLLELSVGNRLDRLPLRPHLLEEQQRQKRDDEIPKVDLELLIHDPIIWSCHRWDRGRAVPSIIYGMMAPLPG